MPTIAFDYDLDGTNPDNFIPNEAHAVIPPTAITDASVIVPRNAPFHEDDFVVKTGSINSPTILTKNVDYYFVYRFIRASRTTGRNIWGGIMLTNRNFNGNIWIDYRTIGGDAVLDDFGVVEQFSRSMRNVRWISWDQLAGLPAGFPVADHPVGGDTLVNLNDVADSVNNVAAAITDVNGGGAGSAALQAHLTSNNAHTPSQVGLGNLNNWGIATANDYNVGNINVYATAKGVHDYVEGKLTDQTTEMGILDDRIEAVETGLAGAVTTLDSMTTSLTSMGSAITTAESNVSTLSGNVSSLSTAVSTNTDAISDLALDLGAAQAAADAAAAQAANALDEIDDINDTLTTHGNDITALKTAVARDKLAGNFDNGNFRFMLLPNESKDIIIVAPGGNGGKYVDNYSTWSTVTTSFRRAVLKRLTHDTTGAALSAAVTVATVHAGNGGRYSTAADGGIYGIGGTGGDAVIISGEVEVGYTAVDGGDGVNGTSGDTGPTAGAAGHTVGSVVYGKGIDGDQYAGSGGAGGRAEFTLKNNSAVPQWYHLDLNFGYGYASEQVGYCLITHVAAP